MFQNYCCIWSNIFNTEKIFFFEKIKDEEPHNDMLWLLCGDFNVTLLQEKIETILTMQIGGNQ